VQGFADETGYHVLFKWPAFGNREMLVKTSADQW